MVAKSAAVRHVAQTNEEGNELVLKGGTLLTHVYKSPRQSVGDADYLHLNREVMTDDLEQAMKVEEGSFSMTPELSYDERSQSFSGKGVFSFEDIRISRRRDRELKITVSIRAGERIDKPERTLEYSDPTLAGTSSFPIEGLTINELSAEKILA